MLKKLIVVLLMLLNSQVVLAQILPAEGNTLNYRIIGFSFPKKDMIFDCKLEIATGDYHSEESFRKNIIKTINTTKSNTIAEVPLFACRYTWRIVDANNKSKSVFHHFSTGSLPGSNNSRLSVKKTARKHQDAYLFADNTRTLYDMSGNPVWYLPENTVNSTHRVLDLKASPFGTITFIADDKVYEIDYNGSIVWQPPHKAMISGDSIEHFHHEFTRLQNGNYMVLGCEQLPCLQCLNDTNFSKNYKANQKLPDIPFGTIIEYDKNGNILWSWKSSKYYYESDLHNYRNLGLPMVDMHENSFYFDEKDSIVYVSFKHVSRILKIKYPEGYVINSLGEHYKPASPAIGNGTFCNQHSIKCLKNKNILMYNNNSCNNGLPSILMLEKPKAGDSNLKIMWQYECQAEGNRPEKFTTGGAVTEMSTQDLFVCMGNNYGKMFILSKKKEILWSGVTEIWNESEKKWEPVGQYRSSIIESGKELERLIWHIESQGSNFDTN